MAQRTITVLTDDLTGKELPDGSGECVRFSIDGDHYEIDLDSSNAQRLRGILDRYAHAGRRVRSGPAARASTSGEAPAALIDNSAVRAWAASNGIQVSKRGRPSASVIEQFRAAGH